MFLLKDDNTRSNRLYVVIEFSQTEDIIRMDWALYSFVLSRIEHVWDAIMRRNHPRTLEKSIFLEEWRVVPQD